MLLISFLGKDNKDKRYDVVLVRSLGKLVQVRMSKAIQLKQSQKKSRILSIADNVIRAIFK